MYSHISSIFTEKHRKRNTSKKMSEAQHTHNQEDAKNARRHSGNLNKSKNKLYFAFKTDIYTHC